jgi:predicted O-methyltransferase YrrM
MSRAGSRSGSMPWQARARVVAQRIGVDPRHLRRVRWLHKARTVRRNEQPIGRHLRFVFLDPEPDNCTFNIANLAELAAWVAQVADCDVPLAQQLIAEPASDAALRERIRAATRGHWWWTKREPPFGKRLGWYALVRALQPERIIEVGAHDGLSATLLLRALELNAQDGSPGRLVSFDINPTAGWLVGSHPFWRLEVQDSRDGLLPLLQSEGLIDMFIYDGWHNFSAELADLCTAHAHLRVGGVLISDDAQVTHALAALAREHDLEYVEFHEQPISHFHPGAVLAAGRQAARPEG